MLDDSVYDEITKLNNELINARRELTKSNIALEKANELKNQMLGVAAHDLRNPLANIGLLSESLLDREEISEETQIEYLQHIRDTSHFMLDLVSDLLDVSMIENGRINLNRTKTDLVALIKKSLSINSLIADNKKIRLEFTTELDTADVYVDNSKIRQVLNNLLTNAIKFSNPGSRVEVKLTENAAEYRCCVADTGQGIKEDDFDRLFQPFRRTSTSPTAGEKSTGLGLYIAKRLVEAHDGTISAESTYGEGTTFRFTLPKSPPQGENGP